MKPNVFINTQNPADQTGGWNFFTQKPTIPASKSKPVSDGRRLSPSPARDAGRKLGNQGEHSPMRSAACQSPRATQQMTQAPQIPKYGLQKPISQTIFKMPEPEPQAATRNLVQMTQERFGQITIDSSDNSEFYLEVSEHDEKELCIRDSNAERYSEKIAPTNDIDQNGQGGITEKEDGDHFVMHSVDNAFREHRFTVDCLTQKLHSERKLSENSPPQALLNPISSSGDYSSHYYEESKSPVSGSPFALSADGTHEHDGTTEGRGSLSDGRWSKAEHQRFLQALDKYGNNWQKVQLVVKTRSAAQIRSHAQKYKLKLMYEEAQEKFKNVPQEERCVFKVVKPKKRKPKQEPAIGSLTKATGIAFTSAKLFDVKKYVVPSGASSNKGLPTSGSENSSEDAASEKKSNESMRSTSQEHIEQAQASLPSDALVGAKKAKTDYSFAKRIFNIVKWKKDKPKQQEIAITQAVPQPPALAPQPQQLNKHQILKPTPIKPAIQTQSGAQTQYPIQLPSIQTLLSALPPSHQDKLVFNNQTATTNETYSGGKPMDSVAPYQEPQFIQNLRSMPTLPYQMSMVSATLKKVPVRVVVQNNQYFPAKE